MKTFTGYEYLLIDIASKFGHDDKPFEERIQWTKDHMAQLEALTEQAKTKERPRYVKAVMALRQAQRGEKIHHLTGLDASCSGMQIMSVVTGCERGAYATGLIDPERPMDAYTLVTDNMRSILGHLKAVERNDAKKATMTTLYASRATPKRIFGEDTPELNAFYKALYNVAPGAMELLQLLLQAWNPTALQHCWTLPDGFEARIKVMDIVETRIEVDELNHASFTYQYKENLPMESGISLPANVTHSLDALLLRELLRRCNYNAGRVQLALEWVQAALNDAAYDQDLLFCEGREALIQARQRFADTGLVSLRWLEDFTPVNVRILSKAHLQRLEDILLEVLKYPPFPVITVHDEFMAHPNHLNRLRYWYKEILAELAESTVIDDILSQLYGVRDTLPKRSKNLAAKIRQSNYGLH